MPGISMSFVADPALAAQMKEIARSDGISTSQAAARASALGALVPAAARRTARRIMEEGDDDMRCELAMQVSRAIGRVGHAMVERRLLAAARERGEDTPEKTDEDLVAESLRMVDDVKNMRG